MASDAINNWIDLTMANRISTWFMAILASIVVASPIHASSQVEWIGDTRSQAEATLPLSHQRPVGQALVSLARLMLGRPYIAFSLDGEPAERLRLDLTAFDCVLFVEQLLALIHSHAIDDFPIQVRHLRYANAVPDYCQRNHYFSVWAQNAEKQGYIKDISPDLPGAVTRLRRLTFMSSHPQAYRPMKQGRAKQCISNLEQHLSVSQSFIPLSSLSAASPSLESGDIFALVTSIHGLDVTHTGILERDGTHLNALHAIPDHGVVRTTSFVEYASKVEDVIGVSIYRPRSSSHSN